MSDRWKPCKWKRERDAYGTTDGNTWNTSCGKEFILLESTPKQNGMKFCPFCGGQLTTRPPRRKS